MVRSELSLVSGHIFNCLQAQYWNGEHWRNFKGEVEHLHNLFKDILSTSIKAARRLVSISQGLLQ